MDPRTCAPPQTRVEATHMVLPGHTNNHGTVFGGQVAAWIDICAAVSAQRFARKPVVTASIDELHFLLPVRRGMTVVLQSMVNQAWRTSMEVGVRVEAEDPRSGERIHCCSAYLTFVALDASGRPSPLPTLVVDGDPDCARRAAEAQRRRDHRLAMREERRRQQ
ncbi:MAG: acyl-CoA thioesterase [Alphaproteobacteria bacterium]|nr:acyl-CoA thioesterase [Alphaproteobacteria bacterium]